MTSRQQPGVQPDRIEVDDQEARARWARRLDVSEQQLRDAVVTVGPVAADVEMYLKGSRSTTNADRVDELGGV